jgi:hypothetical protein
MPAHMRAAARRKFAYAVVLADGRAVRTFVYPSSKDKDPEPAEGCAFIELAGGPTKTRCLVHVGSALEPGQVLGKDQIVMTWTTEAQAQHVANLIPGARIAEVMVPS